MQKKKTKLCSVVSMLLLKTTKRSTHYSNNTGEELLRRGAVTTSAAAAGAGAATTLSNCEFVHNYLGSSWHYQRKQSFGFASVRFGSYLFFCFNSVLECVLLLCSKIQNTKYKTQNTCIQHWLVFNFVLCRL